MHAKQSSGVKEQSTGANEQPTGAKRRITSRALTAFYVPMRTLTLTVALGVVILNIARIPLGIGFLINFLAMFMTLLLFNHGASQLRNVNTVGVRPATHAVGGVIFGVLWSIAVALANTASITVAYLRDYYYYSTDSFMVAVPGIRQLIDTNGEFYEVINAGVTAKFFAINFAVQLVCLAAMTAVGALLGTLRARWNGLVSAIFAVVSVFIAIQAALWMYDLGYRVEAPVPGVFVFLIPLTIVAMILAVILSLTSIRRRRPTAAEHDVHTAAENTAPEH